jgi:hypothetical protein
VATAAAKKPVKTVEEAPLPLKAIESWNEFCVKLQELRELWTKHCENMYEEHVLVERLDPELGKELLKDFWRSPFDLMIERFVSFYVGEDLRNLVVKVPQVKKKEGKSDDSV